MWTWTSWPRWPMASPGLTWQRSASGRVSWPSGRASRTRSAERGRDRPTHQQWSVPFLSPGLVLHSKWSCSSCDLFHLYDTYVYFVFSLIGGGRGRSCARDQEGPLWGGNAICSSFRQWQWHSQIRDVCSDSAAEPWLWQLQVLFLFFIFLH